MKNFGMAGRNNTRLDGVRHADWSRKAADLTVAPRSERGMDWISLLAAAETSERQ